MAARILAILLLVCVPAGLSAAEKPTVPPRIKAYLDRSREEKPLVIRRLKMQVAQQRQTLARAKRGRIVPGRRGTLVSGPVLLFPSREAKAEKVQTAAERLKATQSRLDALRRGYAEHFAEMLPGPPKVGKIGRLSDRRVKVIQVIDADTMLVRNFWTQGSQWIGRDGHPRYSEPDEVYFWVEGVPTAGFVSDRQAELHQVFEIVATKTYPTLAGSNTVFVLRLLELTPYLPKRSNPGETKATVRPSHGH